MRWGIKAMREKRAGWGGRALVGRALVEACERRVMLAGDGIVGQSLVGAVDLGVVSESIVLGEGLTRAYGYSSYSQASGGLFSFDLTEADRVVLQDTPHYSEGFVSPVPLGMVKDIDGDGLVDDGEVLGTTTDRGNGTPPRKHVVLTLDAGRYFVVLADPEVPEGRNYSLSGSFTVARMVEGVSAGSSPAEAADLGILGDGIDTWDTFDVSGDRAWYRFRVEQDVIADVKVGWLPTYERRHGVVSPENAARFYMDVDGDGQPSADEVVLWQRIAMPLAGRGILRAGNYLIEVRGESAIDANGQGEASINVANLRPLPVTPNNAGTANLSTAPTIVLGGDGSALLSGIVPHPGSAGAYFKLVIPDGYFGWPGTTWPVRLFRDANANGIYDDPRFNSDEAIAMNSRLSPGTYGVWVPVGADGLTGSGGDTVNYYWKLNVDLRKNQAPGLASKPETWVPVTRVVFTFEGGKWVDPEGGPIYSQMYRESNGVEGPQTGEGGDELLVIQQSDYYIIRPFWPVYRADSAGTQRFYGRVFDEYNLASEWTVADVRFDVFSPPRDEDPDQMIATVQNSLGTTNRVDDGETIDFGSIRRGEGGLKVIGLVWRPSFESATKLRASIEGSGFRLIGGVPDTLMPQSDTSVVVEMDSSSEGPRRATLVVDWEQTGGGRKAVRFSLAGTVLGPSGGDVPGGGNAGGEPPVVDSSNVAIIGGVKGIKAGTFVAGKPMGKGSVRVGLPQGGTVAREVAISYYLSADEVWDGNDVLVGTTTTNLKLSGKKTKSVSTALTAPMQGGDGQAVVRGSYRVLAVVDSGRVMMEVNEADNVAMVPTAVGIEPRRVGLSGVVLGGGKLVAGKTGTIKVRITNRGNIDLDTDLAMGLFASVRPILDVANDHSLATFSSRVKLKPGASRVVSYRYTNATTLEGPLYVFGRVDGSLMGVGLAGPAVFSPAKLTLFVPPPPSTESFNLGAGLNTGGSGTG